MTLTNVGIKPEELTDEHLRAEWREIQRLPYNYKAALKSGSIGRIPRKFKLGEGHVLFFLNKWRYVFSRTIDLHVEMQRRGFLIMSFVDIPMWEWWKTAEIKRGDYTATESDRRLLIARITQRITNSVKPYWHYYGKRISKEDAVELLINRVSIYKQIL